jgi:hypothetical protein
MRKLRILAVAMVAWLVAATSARAGTLVTNPILLESTRRLSCIVVNEGKRPVRDVVVEVVRYNVPPPATIASTDNIEELLPLQYIALGFENVDGDAVMLCRFKFPGSGKWLRASGVVRESGGAVFETHPAR